MSSDFIGPAKNMTVMAFYNKCALFQIPSSILMSALACLCVSYLVAIVTVSSCHNNHHCLSEEASVCSGTSLPTWHMSMCTPPRTQRARSVLTSTPPAW